MKRQNLFNLLTASFLVLGLFLGMAPARPSQAEAAAPTAGVSPAGLLNPDGSLNLSSGFQGALDLSGWEVTLDSERGPLLTPAAQASRSASDWDPSWKALPSRGLNGIVNAMAVIGQDVFVGGSFTATSDGTVTGMNRIARYSMIGGWASLPNLGLNGNVTDLAVIGTDLYVGGLFTATGDGAVTGLNRIARYDTNSMTWHALPNQGLNGGVYALAAINNSHLYVGGAFSATADGALTSLGNVAFYNTVADAWYDLPNQGLNGVVNAMAVSGDDLYVGGQFTATGDGSLTNLGYIARYHTTAPIGWSALPHQGLNGWVIALAVAGDNVYVGGIFNTSGDGAVTPLNLIARYDIVYNSWNALAHQGLNNYVYALAVVGDDLYVGGAFSQTADGAITGLGHIVRYDTFDQQWCTLPNLGLNNAVLALAVGDRDLYVGGNFFATGDGTLLDLGNVAGYNFTPNTWSAMPNDGLNGEVKALAVVGSDLYVGGNFTATGDGALTNLGHIARYDTVAGTWHALPRQGVNSPVHALAVVGSDLYVGGDFTATGDGALTNLGHVARYNTVAGTWHKLPNDGLDDLVLALVAYGSNLYVGGGFSATGSGSLTNLGRIARYDTAANTWYALPHNGLNNWVYALATGGGNLYVGGSFSTTGDGAVASLGNVARYDLVGSTWYALPHQGLNGPVYALAAAGSDLYVGGGFVVSRDGAIASLNHIARYDPSSDTWRALPRRGLSSDVYALAAAGDDLYVGGLFGRTADQTLVNLGGIARFNVRTGAWQAVACQGLNVGAWVNALAVGNGGVFLGGSFNGLGDGELGGLGGIAHYGDIAWRPLPRQGLNSSVEALAVIGDDLYVGGNFTASGDGTLTNLGYIARYDTVVGTWHALPRQGVDSPVYALAAVGSDLYVGGAFTATGDGALSNLGRIARYNTTAGTWHALPRQGLNDYVYTLAVAEGDLGSDLYVGGAFTASGDGTLSNLGYVARYSTTGGTWHALPKQGLDGFVNALAVLGDNLYVGGGFYQTGDGTMVNLNDIARYNMVGEEWSALPRQGLDSYVFALAVLGNDLYVGGEFGATGDGTLTSLGRIVRYDTVGGDWHALPNQGLYYNDVRALAVVGPDLYVGGYFEETGDGTINALGGVARYDSAAGAWHAMPNEGLDSWVNDLVVIGNSLYAAGDLMASGDGTLGNLGRIARIAIEYPYQIYLPLVLK